MIEYRGLYESMKKGKLFFHRLNRGIALGLAIVLAVVLYTVITNQTFKTADKPEIEKLMKDYLSDLAAFSVGFKGATEEHAMTDAEIDARMKTFISFTDQYFAYKKSGAISGVSAQNIEEMESVYRNYLKRTAVGGEILSFSLEPVQGRNGLEISKTGPGCATVFLQVEGLIRTQGKIDERIYVPGAYMEGSSDTIIWETGDGDNRPETEDPDAIYEGRCRGSMRLYLEKTDGRWKIVYAGYAYVNIDEMRVVEGGAGK